MRAARYLEERIDDRFQEIRPDIIAAAQDEGVVHLYVPQRYRGDWEHFAGVVSHLYLNGSSEFSTMKAKQLADEAVKPGSPMREISYALEGLGKWALPVIRERELMSHSDPDVAYGAARAAAHLEDPSAPQVLVNMARKTGHPFQINAIQTLGALRSSPAINEVLRPLLNSPETLVRLETYRMLARNNDNAVFSQIIQEQFVLDYVRSDGPPVVYATRRGEPRIAVIGNRPSINLPVTFTSMDGRLSISGEPNGRTVTIFYRPPMPPRGVTSRQALAQVQPIKIVSRPDIVDVIARLGGVGGDIGPTLNFNYGQIVSILNGLSAEQRLSSTANGQRLAASFILESLPAAEDAIENAPIIGDQGRPTNDEKGKEVGMAR
jgi:hypothetical protein